MEQIDTVKCCNCDWQGDEYTETFFPCYDKDDTQKEEPFRGCPNCLTDHYLTNI